MPKICYVEKNFAASSLSIIAMANGIIEDYQAQGYNLTLRQIYYQFVAHDSFPEDRRWRLVENTGKWVRDPNGTKNAPPNYKWLGSIVNDGRMAGLMDWSALEDRTRNLASLSHWESPEAIVGTCATQFVVDKWANQEFRPEVWVEKEALAGIVGQAAERLDVPYFCCRGYTSQSEMWAAGQRLAAYKNAGQKPFVIHLGDHDPSGVDMTRDIVDRLKMFMGAVILVRIALNMDQIEEFAPPPNPAKITDSRAAGYIAEFGRSSWELDAMEPKMLDDLITETILAIRDDDAWVEKEEEEQDARRELSRTAENWNDIQRNLDEAGISPR